MQLGELARQIAHERTARFSEREIEGISTDSKHVMHGDLFVCFRGGEHDGHDFAAEAVAAYAEHAFIKLELERVEAKHYKENARSGNMLLRAGMRRSGEDETYIYYYKTPAM